MKLLSYKVSINICALHYFILSLDTLVMDNPLSKGARGAKPRKFKTINKSLFGFMVQTNAILITKEY